MTFSLHVKIRQLNTKAKINMNQLEATNLLFGL